LVKLLWHCKNNLIYSVMASLLLASFAMGGLSTGGESGAYLRLPVGPVASAMGNANSASPRFMGAWWNPAVLSTYKTRSAFIGGAYRSQGRTDGFASLSFRIPPRAGMGLMILYRGDPFLNDLHSADEELLGRAAYTTLTIKAAVSYFINRKLSAGASIGFYYQSLPTEILLNNEIKNSKTRGIGGFDFAVRYKVSDHLVLAAIIRKLGLSMDWEIRNSAWDLNSSHEDNVLPEIIIASQLTKNLLGKPFIWNSDWIVYISDGDGGSLSRNELVLNNGFEWQYWEKFYLRAGLGDMAFSTEMFRDSEKYGNSFSPRITAGFSADLSRVRSGMRLHYALTTDKVWAGIDQVLGIALEF